MKNKKIIIAALCFSFACPLNLSAVNAVEQGKASEYVVYNEIEDRAVCYLEGLGINTDFKDNEEITRGDFTALIMKLVYADKIINGGNYTFSDVLNDENAQYIYSALSRGIISQSEEFRPDDGIKYEEAVKMAVTTLGYSNIANLRGGYPSGYIACASEINLTKNVKVTAGAVLNGKDTLKLLYNMLHVDLMMTDVNSSSDISISKSENCTILSEYYKLEKIEGIAEATKYSSLSEEENRAFRDIIEINGKKLEYTSESYDLLGMNVVAYVNENDEAVIVCPVNNNVLQIDTIESYDSFVVEYENGKKTDRIKLDKSFCFIYNGRAYDDYTVENFTKLQGEMKLIDNDRDGDYDIVIAEDVKYMQVKNVDKTNSIIYGQSLYGDKVDADEEETLFSYYRYADGQMSDASLYDIKNGDIVALIVSADGKIGKVIICSDEKDGILVSVGDDVIKIDEQEYKTSNYYNAYHDISIGEYGKFKTGLKNEVVEFKSFGSEDYSYGYLIKANKDDEDEDAAYIKLMNANGDIVKYKCEKELMLDGKKITIAGKWLKNMYPLTDTSNVTQRQLIKYKVKENTVIAIDTAEDITTWDVSVSDSDDSFFRFYNNLTTAYKADGMNTFLRFAINAETKIFTVPQVTQTDVIDKDFNVTLMSALKKDGGYTVDAYDINDSGIAEFVVIYSEETSSNLSDNSSSGVIDSIKDVWNDEYGEVMKEISIWRKGECNRLYLEEQNFEMINKADGKKLKAGDVIRYNCRGDVIRELVLDFDSDKKELTAEGKVFELKEKSYGKIKAYAYGSIYRKLAKNYIVSWTKNGGNWDYSLINLLNIPLTDDASVLVVENDTVTLVPMDSVLDYYSSGTSADEILLIQGYWYCSVAVIYR